MERYLAAVLVLGVSAQWLAWRLRLPSILLLLTFGALLGEYLAWEHGTREPVPTELLFPLVALSVGVILFEGGLSLQIRELRESGAAVIGLVTVGAAVTWTLSTVCLIWLIGIDPRVAAVIGGILVVTGPTVVAPLLRLIRPSRRVASMVKWEGIVIDPIGAVCALLAFEALHAHRDSWVQDSIWSIGKTMVVGSLIGMAGAVVLVQLLKRYLIPDFLHSAAFLAAAVLSFTASNLLQTESGLLTVTVMGIALANQRTVTLKHVIEFKENLQVLLIACLFIVLGSRVDLREVVELGWPIVGFLLVLIFVIRPLSVWASTWTAKISHKERLFLAFLAPRGIVAAAVASVFALEASHLDLPEDVERSLEVMVPIVFVAIAGTVAFYGLASPWIARRLGLSEPSPQGLLLAGADPWVRMLASTLHKAGQQVMLVDTNYSNVASARMAGLEAHCASILAEYVHDEIDMAGIGRLLALTPNDEVNTLAVSEFAHQFGRKHVYQLPPRQPHAGHRREEIAGHLRGRYLFRETLDFDELARRVRMGATVKSTHITLEFSFADFREKYGEDAPLLAVLRGTGELEVVVVDGVREPTAGDTIVFLSPEET
ncbi:MAG: sodium:proton antiporter [Planctomycetales bacterium]|nr:sodium:proton antiporter [Planctomycetales bacterium]